MENSEAGFFDEENSYIIPLRQTDIDAICKQINLRRKGVKLVNSPTTKEEKELRKALCYG